MACESSPQDENWSPRALSSAIAQRQSSGDDVKNLIALTPLEEANAPPVPAVRKSPAKIQTKNHLRANRQALKEKQRNNKDAVLERQAQEKLRRQKIETKKEKLYGKVQSRVYESTSSSLPSPDDVSSASHRSCNSSLHSQSENSYPIAFGRRVGTPADRLNPSSESAATSTGCRHKSYGQVPKYITERRAKIEREEEARRISEANAPPAPGLRLMSEPERLETLRMLDESEKAARDELCNIPFSMNHQKAARLREAIDYRLKELEVTRKIFSAPRVFVSLEDE